MATVGNIDKSDLIESLHLPTKLKKVKFLLVCESLRVCLSVCNQDISKSYNNINNNNNIIIIIIIFI